MENALRACCKGIKIGKILIHGHGTNGRQVSWRQIIHCFQYSFFFHLAWIQSVININLLVSRNGMFKRLDKNQEGMNWF